LVKRWYASKENSKIKEPRIHCQALSLNALKLKELSTMEGGSLICKTRSGSHSGLDVSIQKKTTLKISCDSPFKGTVSRDF
jgi:hypothetical protein